MTGGQAGDNFVSWLWIASIPLAMTVGIGMIILKGGDVGAACHTPCCVRSCNNVEESLRNAFCVGDLPAPG
jgi:hypothetical protein